MSCRAIILVMLVGAITSSVAVAENIPYGGFYYNTRENNVLQTTCRKRDNLLECDFVQTRVRMKAQPEDIKKALSNALSGFSAEQARKQWKDSETCGKIDSFIAGLQGEPVKDEKLLEHMDKLKKATAVQRNDTIRSMTAFSKMCRDPNEANFADVVEITHDIETRTCVVSTNTFQQTFRKVDGADVWAVVQDGPEGECGTINVSRLERDKSTTMVSLWKYFSQKVITNKDGELLPGMKCSDLDETEYEFDWREQDNLLSCDYVKFSAF